MELFNKTGHLTDEGLNALLADGLSELQRLEAAEHLDYCDLCLMRHMELMDATGDDALLPLPNGFAEKTVKAAQTPKGKPVFLRRWVPAAAAVCLTVGLWIAGYFTPAIRDSITQMAPVSTTAAAAAMQTAEDAAAEKERHTADIGEQFNMAASHISNQFSEFFLSLRTPDAPQEAPANSGD